MKRHLFFIALFPILLTACQSQRPATRVVAVTPAVSTQSFNISSDTLFHFNRYTLGDMLPGGMAELDQLVGQLQNSYVSVSQIAIIGHTDRIGSDVANQHLGMQRALTVQNYLRSRGVTAEITVASMGERQPRTQNCSAQLNREALKSCLQPDRRVSIHVTGVRRI